VLVLDGVVSVGVLGVPGLDDGALASGGVDVVDAVVVSGLRPSSEFNANCPVAVCVAHQ
jgi:hypothetical protein